MITVLIALVLLFLATNIASAAVIARERAIPVSTRLLTVYHGEVLVYGVRALRGVGLRAMRHAGVLISIVHLLVAVALVVALGLSW